MRRVLGPNIVGVEEAVPEADEDAGVAGGEMDAEADEGVEDVFNLSDE